MSGEDKLQVVDFKTYLEIKLIKNGKTYQGIVDEKYVREKSPIKDFEIVKAVFMNLDSSQIKDDKHPTNKYELKAEEGKKNIMLIYRDFYHGEKEYTLILENEQENLMMRITELEKKFELLKKFYEQEKNNNPECEVDIVSFNKLCDNAKEVKLQSPKNAEKYNLWTDKEYTEVLRKNNCKSGMINKMSKNVKLILETYLGKLTQLSKTKKYHLCLNPIPTIYFDADGKIHLRDVNEVEFTLQSNKFLEETYFIGTYKDNNDLNLSDGFIQLEFSKDKLELSHKLPIIFENKKLNLKESKKSEKKGKRIEEEDDDVQEIKEIDNSKKNDNDSDSDEKDIMISFPIIIERTNIYE